MLSQTENVEEEGGRQIFFYSGNKNWKMMISFWIVQEWEMNKKKKKKDWELNASSIADAHTYWHLMNLSMKCIFPLLSHSPISNITNILCLLYRRRFCRFCPSIKINGQKRSVSTHTHTNWLSAIMLARQKIANQFLPLFFFLSGSHPPLNSN